MKPQARTLIEKHGFVDPDRSFALHDDIHLWTFDNLENILSSFGKGKKRIEVWFKEMEYPIVQSARSFQSIVGFIDIYGTGRVIDISTSNEQQFRVCIEVKTRIHSCGDLIRQVNFYRKFQISGGVWIVVSPDDRFAKTLRDHDIRFYKFVDAAAIQKVHSAEASSTILSNGSTKRQLELWS